MLHGRQLLGLCGFFLPRYPRRGVCSQHALSDASIHRAHQLDILQQASFRLLVAKLTNNSRLAWQRPSAGAQAWREPEGWRLLFHQGGLSSSCQLLHRARCAFIACIASLARAHVLDACLQTSFSTLVTLVIGAALRARRIARSPAAARAVHQVAPPATALVKCLVGARLSFVCLDGPSHITCHEL